jgi:hypothetical protein
MRADGAPSAKVPLIIRWAPRVVQLVLKWDAHMSRLVKVSSLVVGWYIRKKGVMSSRSSRARGLK